MILFEMGVVAEWIQRLDVTVAGASASDFQPFSRDSQNSKE
jgi:hypothetical protein